MNENEGQIYIIRVREDDISVMEEKFGSLEKMLGDASRARVDYVIPPISAFIACIYDSGLVNAIEEAGYELILQEKRNMLYDKTQPIASPTVDSIDVQ